MSQPGLDRFRAGLPHCQWARCSKTVRRPLRRFRDSRIAVTIEVTSRIRPDTLKKLQRKRLYVADTTKIEDRLERKKLKRTARKKAAPKAKRTAPRGANKKKLKKLARGVSKR
jgi:hypothetical protein